MRGIQEESKKKKKKKELISFQPEEGGEKKNLCVRSILHFLYSAERYDATTGR